MEINVHYPSVRIAQINENLDLYSVMELHYMSQNVYILYDLKHNSIRPQIGDIL